MAIFGVREIFLYSGSLNVEVSPLTPGKIIYINKPTDVK
jgi:hypothetical protein